ncbi:hypothetical protein [Flavobacterium sp. HSC-61S13]|uniref:hypothetical protein n=1 Tax=Flavobacterium sp. HSC-61S13 TaxID=2910963 RepID=UPI00209E5495|nr:hypothetical protein [Flavobacterium sp. HSC-61S13]MCP1995376.1 hypothetical protein [Flavobacterium sp. HSC-61S13]
MKLLRVVLGVLFVLTASHTVYGQVPCMLTAHLDDFIQMKEEVFDGESDLIARIKESHKTNCASSSIDQNKQMLDYILVNFTARLDYEKFKLISDSVVLQQTYIKTLEKDSLFTAVLNDFSRKVIDKTEVKDTVSMNQLMNLAVKFFSIAQINEDDNYVGRVCVGSNSIKDTEPNRHAFAEAFCFVSIFENYEGERYNMSKEFIDVLWILKDMNLGINCDERLLRAQGAMFVLMKKNQNLSDMLEQSFEEKKDFLPFILKKES